MGRKPIGKQAMTDAERQRRRRAKFRDSNPVTKTSGISSAEKHRLEEKIARLEEENRKFRDTAPVTKVQSPRKTTLEHDRQKYASHLKKMPKDGILKEVSDLLWLFKLTAAAFVSATINIRR